jgi:carbon-monoxide dehydrogenase iron sulfur subunit
MPEPRVTRSYSLPGVGVVKDDTPQPVVVPRSGRLTVDAARCSGCRDCEMVCSLHHEGAVRPSKARLSVTHDLLAEVHPRVLLCPQCLGPECMLVCPTGAIVADTSTGARVVVDDLCKGCGLCEKACHLGMIHVDAASKKAFKCDLCGGEPQCVTYCPQRVLSYEERRRR